MPPIIYYIYYLRDFKNINIIEYFISVIEIMYIFLSYYLA